MTILAIYLIFSFVYMLGISVVNDSCKMIGYNKKNEENMKNAAKTIKSHHHNLDLLGVLDVLYTPVSPNYLFWQMGDIVNMKTIAFMTIIAQIQSFVSL